MREPELLTPLVQELWNAYIEEINPRLDSLGGTMGMMIKGIKLSYLDAELPGLFESLDQDPELQALITARVRAVLERIDAGLYALSELPIKNETADFVRYDAGTGSEDPRDLYAEETNAENENSISNQE
jgi:hypothetical protein